MATDKLIQPTKDLLGKEVAPVDGNWTFFNKLSAMPNPDPILRRLGRSANVYASIMADAHVMGEIRSIRGSFRSLDYRVVVGDESDSRSKAARDLCEWWLEHVEPNEVAVDWQEVMWQMCSAIFTGHKIHEVIWNYVSGKLLPVAVKDRANSRFKFDADGKVLLLSQGNIEGVAVEPWQFVASRHMADCDNPYGKALISSCFWPWTFKTGGFKYFVQYCERHGMPWPFAEYPQGATEKEIRTLQEAIGSMLNNGWVVAPAGTKLTFLESNATGSALPQENLINLCNREMSKALTGQAMVAEAQATGARAAAETAAARSDGIHDSDRDIAAASFGTIFKFITQFNFGTDIAPPKLEFFKRKAATKERAESYQIAAQLGARPSKRSLLEELNIPAADDDADAILAAVSSATQMPPVTKSLESNFTEQFAVPLAELLSKCQRNNMTFEQFKDELTPFFGTAEFAKTVISGPDPEADFAAAASDAFDTEFEAAVIQPFADMLDEFIASGKDLSEFKDSLGALLQGVDDAELLKITQQALTLSALHGAVEHKVEV